MIVVEHLTKKYGEFTAVRDLSFAVGRGKIWGLLGPNGSGKTTTMRVLTGFLSASEGRVTVGGFDVFERPDEVKKLIGYLPENVPLYPEMTVAGYLGFVAEIKQVPGPRRKEAVARAVESCGLEPVRDRLIRNISRGFRQRAGLAQALIHDPRVLILDEPTIGLDPAQIVEIRELIKSLRGERTIMLSTHILQEVSQTCDGVAIISEGKLVASSSLAELASSFGEREGVVLKVRRGAREAAPALRRVKGVENVEHQANELRVEWSRGLDPREEILDVVADRGLGLLEMRSAVPSVEDLYLKVVSGGTVQ
jgi:ABC-2 type transport system ATP-binding protein